MRPTIEPRTVDDVRDLSIHNQRKHPRPVVWIVFEVGVLDDYDIAGGARETGPHGGAFAPITLVKKDGKREAAIALWAVCREVELAAAVERHTTPDPFCMCQIPPHPLRGPVARGIIHNDYLFRYLGHRSYNLQYHTPDGAHFIVDRNDDGQHKWRFRVKRVLFHAPLIAPQLRRHSSGVSRGIGEIVDSKRAVRDLHDRSRRSPGYPGIATRIQLLPTLHSAIQFQYR